MNHPSIKLRPAFPEDIPFVRECIERFRLDDEDIDYHQFVVAVDGDDIAGFGRIRPHKNVFELGMQGRCNSDGLQKKRIKHPASSGSARDVAF